MKKAILLLFTLLSTQISFGQINVKVGEKVPDLVITDYIQNTPSDKNFNNKFKIVEFWATWCGPCLAAVPHINELQNKYKDNKNLVFISISDETPEKIKKTLDKIRFETIVVSDQSQKSHKSLIMKGESYSIPQTILIDNQNIVRWIGYPNLLNHEVIDNFLSGQLGPKAKPDVEKVDKKELVGNDVDIQKIYTNTDIHYAVAFSRTNPAKMAGIGNYMDVGNGRLMLFKHDAQSALSIINGEPAYKIIVEKPISEEIFDFMYKNDQYKAKTGINNDANAVLSQNEIKSFLLKKLNAKESMVNIPKDVYLLKVADADKLKNSENLSKTTNSHYGSSASYFTYDNGKLSKLVPNLYYYYKIIVLDETKTDGKYDFLLKIGSVEGLIEELNTYGLKLEKTQRNIDCYKYESTQ